MRIALFVAGQRGAAGVRALISDKRLQAEIAVIVAPFTNGEPEFMAYLHNIPFEYLPGPDYLRTEADYRWIIDTYEVDLVVSWGWVGAFKGISCPGVNFRPARLPEKPDEYYGFRTQSWVLRDYNAGFIKETAATFHFIDGPTIHEFLLPIKQAVDRETGEITQDSIASAVEELGLKIYPIIINMVAGGQVLPDGTRRCCARGKWRIVSPPQAESSPHL